MLLIRAMICVWLRPARFVRSLIEAMFEAKTCVLALKFEIYSATGNIKLKLETPRLFTETF